MIGVDVSCVSAGMFRVVEVTPVGPLEGPTCGRSTIYLGSTIYGTGVTSGMGVRRDGG